MPVLVLFGIFAVWAIAKIYDAATTVKHVWTAEELENMRKEMIGKSVKECNKILDRYVKEAKENDKNRNELD